MFFRGKTPLNFQLREVLDSALLFQCSTFYLSTGTFNVNFRANIHIFKPSGGFRVQATQNGNRDFLYLFISLWTEAEKCGVRQISSNLKIHER